MDKALTICQPYAELIMRGEKPIENRTWYTGHRGDLLIHAGKSRDWLDPDDLARYPDMPFGAVVGVVRVVACLDYEAKWGPEYRALHNHEHANGPWCWVLEDVRRFRAPIPYRGSQGLWVVPMDLHHAVNEAKLSLFVTGNPVSTEGFGSLRSAAQESSSDSSSPPIPRGARP